jgi:hypothetical protein
VYLRGASALCAQVGAALGTAATNPERRMNLPHDLTPDDADLARRLRDSRTLEAPPSHVLQRAFDVWRPRPAPSPGLLQRLVAALRFDSASTPALAHGVRSAGAAPRQLLYSAEGHDIDLRIEPRPDGSATLRGQVLGPSIAGHAALQRSGVAGPWQAESALDDLGEFGFDPVPPGEYSLALELGAVCIDLPPIAVGAASPP